MKQKNVGRKKIEDATEKKQNIQCYMPSKDFVKIGRRQAAIMARHFIKQLNDMLEEGEPVIVIPEYFKVVKSHE